MAKKKITVTATSNEITTKAKKEKKPRKLKATIKFTPAEGSLTESALQLKEELEEATGVVIDPKKNPLFAMPKKVTDYEEMLKNIEIFDYNEMRALIRQFYNIYQHNRISAQNQERSLTQGYSKGDTHEILLDNAEDTPDFNYMAHKYVALAALVDFQVEQEKGLKNIIEKFVVSKDLGLWLTSITGIGPLLAGNLMAYLKPVEYSSCVWSYAGYNDNNDPWLKGEKVPYIMKRFVKNDPVTMDEITAISAYTGRKASRIIEGAGTIDIRTGQTIIKKRDLEAYLKKPPYNRELKKVCYKIGQSILKLSSNPKSLYGQLFLERWAYEKAKNANHDYIQEALKSMDFNPIEYEEKGIVTPGFIFKKDLELPRSVEEKWLKEMQQAIDSGAFKPGIGKTAETYKRYYEGYLCDAHILARSLRWTVKVMLSHIYEAMWIDAHKNDPDPDNWYPPALYVHLPSQHNRYIEPEVPYSNVWSHIDMEKIKATAINTNRSRGLLLP